MNAVLEKTAGFHRTPKADRRSTPPCGKSAVSFLYFQKGQKRHDQSHAVSISFSAFPLLRANRYLHHTVALLFKQLIGFLNLFQRIGVGNQRCGI